MIHRLIDTPLARVDEYSLDINSEWVKIRVSDNKSDQDSKKYMFMLVYWLADNIRGSDLVPYCLRHSELKNQF
jgi:hypothetical protein